MMLLLYTFCLYFSPGTIVLLLSLSVIVCLLSRTNSFFFFFIFTVFLEQTIMAQSNLRNYLRSLRWTPLPVGVGLALIAFQQYRHTRKREAAKLGQLQPCDCLAEEWEVAAYKLLPLRSFSRAWGWVNGKFDLIFADRRINSQFIILIIIFLFVIMALLMTSL